MTNNPLAAAAFEPDPPAAELDAIHAGVEDAIHAGLEPEQEIRARALERAVELAACEIHLPATRLGEVLDIAEGFAAYIRTGQRPS